MEREVNLQWSNGNGAIEAVRVAAYCPRRISKKLIDQTNIPASVDTILLKQVPIVSHRVLGYLLLGVVRIFSKKVQYACDNCDYLRVVLNTIVGRERTNMTDEAMRAPFSIILPTTFQLDAFDLQISEERTSAHIRPSEELVLKDAEQHFLNKNYLLGDGSSAASRTPLEEGSERVESIEKLRGNNSFSLDEFLSSIIPGLVEQEPQRNDETFVEVEEASAVPAHDEDGSVDSIEGITEMLSPLSIQNDGGTTTIDATPVSKGPNYSGTSIPSMMEPPVADKVTSVGVQDLSAAVSHNEDRYTDTSEQMILSQMVSLKDANNIDETPQSEGPNSSAADNVASVGVEEFSAAVSDNEDQDTDTSEQITVSEMILRKSTKNKQASVTVDVSGHAMSAFTPVQMSNTTESCRVSRKRKRSLVDDSIILPGSLIKNNILDPSEIIRERRKCQKLSNLAQTLFESLIPYSSKIGSVIPIEKLKRIQVIETTKAPEEMNPTVEQLLNVPDSPVSNPSPDQARIAPSMPVSNPTSSKSHDGPLESIYFDSLEEDDDDYSDTDNGVTNEDIDMRQGHCWEQENWSLRTRAAASAFCQNFSSLRKQKEDEVANLFQILEGKNKSESARMFYEVLVLRSGGYVDVEQQAPYDDIVITGTTKLKKVQDF